MIIPKNLVSFYHDSDLPNKMKENVSHWISTNPNLDIKIFNIESAEKFISENFSSEVHDAYKILKPYSYKSDLFRFCYIYKYGGIYVDIKYKQIDNFRLEELLDKEHLVEEPMGIQSCLFALSKENPLLLKCIETVVSNTLSYDYGYTPILTGPIPLSDNFLKFYAKKRIDDLSWNIDNHLQTIKKNGKIILQQYTEYRDELSSSDQPHYEYLYWNKDIYNITISTDNMPSDEDVLCYLQFYPDLKKAFGKDIAKGRQHWFHYGKREGRKIKFDESEKMRLLNKNLKKEWKVIINKDNKSNPVHILSKRNVIKDYFMFIHKIENKYIVKLERKQEFKKDKASQFILNKQEKGYSIVSCKYPDISMNVIKKKKYELIFSKIDESSELGIFNIESISPNRVSIKVDDFLLDSFRDKKEGKLRLTKSKESPKLYGGWGLFNIIES